MIVSSLSSIGPGTLQAICDGLGDSTLAIRLLAGIEADSTAPSHAMWALAADARRSPVVNETFEAGVTDVLAKLRASSSSDARRFLDGFDELIRLYGSRGPNEWDVIAQTWEVRPQTALAAIDLMRASDPSNAPTLRKAASIAERDRVAADIRARLADDAEALGTFEAALRSSQLFLSGRERYKTNCIMLVGEIRMCLREIGRRMVDQGVIESVEQIFMLTNAEFDELRFEPNRFKSVIAERWSRYRELFDIEPIFLVSGHVPPLAVWPRRLSDDRDAFGRWHGAHRRRGVGRSRHRPGACRARPVRPDRVRTRRCARCAPDRPVMDSAVRACRGCGRERRCDGQPRHDRVTRTRHSVRRFRSGRNGQDPRRRDGDCRWQRGNRDDPLTIH